MIKEIGSTYWLAPGSVEGFPKKSMKTPNVFNGASYVSTCRSAIGIVLDTLSSSVKKVALLPAFTCESVLISFIDRGYKVYPYPICKDLTIKWDIFKRCLMEIVPSVILVHSYFGFDTIAELRSHVLDLRKQGFIIIEDETQSMFSCSALAYANYYVGSIRKWMPLPDGAFVSVPFHCNEEDKELTDAKMKAFLQKGNWILNGFGEKTIFRQMFKEAEILLNSRKKPFAMSSLSRELFAHIDKEKMKMIRRKNCTTLISGIFANSTLNEKLQLPFSKLGTYDCPFHLPVLVKEGRKDLQQYLAKHNIFATVIWGCPNEFKEIIDEDSMYVYNHILCFHIDQRYNDNDMMRIIDSLKEYYAI